MIPDPVVLQLTSDWTTTALLRIIGFALFASVTAMGAAFVYRGYSTRRLPLGVGVLLGLAFVTVVMNVGAVTQPTIISDTPKLHYATASYFFGVYVAGTVTAEAGRRIGDHFARDVFGVETVEGGGEVARLVQSAGLVVAVEVPDDVDDLDGYPPVDDETRRRLEGRTLLFPRRLTDEELESRLVARLKRDFDVSHVHVDYTDGEIASLAVGRRPAGLGPSLPPQTVAVALQGDPAPDASTGDPVEVWTDEDGASRLLATGTFRARVGDCATVTVSEDDADVFDPSETYRIVTRPDTANDVHELLATLGQGAETVTTATVTEDDPLRGEFVAWLPVSVLVVDRDGEVIPFPADNETLDVGDEVYVIGTPAGLHALAEYEAQSGSLDEVEEEIDDDGALAKVGGD